ncbi:hypothetical protein COW36_02705 [bacterium (Candidatus Blackallbacteria) CG17_big_fil_post_rev_8_21_14_2_50_48_46]|uniref:Uncharacterized protein n=1 Tax=bacterium (Candidatus Blackallbacteria) CG17_big_fil_post_rev_8_21_14_2_50_48_46 TaxID=2014261 RepID=A0A2M7GA66_9BACT|nr:MAG: hypothetical protein COW64_12770 [bacterium (Candidatus Blackallbacteria) CG18_big_fil_WC_8_21_14_2_50_49_26]PIW19039.1 MAG: hypothetical protein COW36_02705 [bacterium (Candidatus Blackallbacteria) CG17_big_fil_post_rev_8_21_14_2_50_48_46]PIW44594.1 MAG: hypothetical protein COW20_23415 [bacterium (Candidatus Blackallbacteria) CG13_big_fil_rev_8_21_14_2_50_49_14]
MGRGDFGFDGLYSLGAINSWIGVINSNLNATSRTGYKANKVKFRGGVSEIVRNPNGPMLGIQMPETTLQIDESSIDFSQGSIVASTEPTHLAIQGKGFFRLATNIGAGAGSVATGIAYYSRDGEFHVVNHGGVLRLVHSTGLYLVDLNGRGAILDVTNGLIVVNATAFAAGVHIFDETDVFNTSTPNFLRFSRYGSTVFESTADSVMTALAAGDARVISQSLESSNSSLSQTLPELSLAQKFFSAVSKVISVHQTNLDTVINLVR